MTPSPAPPRLEGRAALAPSQEQAATTDDMANRRTVRASALALFLISAAALAFEIALTRLFSLLFQYHYAFLALSLAVLGLGVGAIAGRSLIPTREMAGKGSRGLPAAPVILGFSFPLTAVLLAYLPVTGSILPQASVALIPFVLTGLTAALIFACFPAHSGWLYASDLAGAAGGAIVVLPLLSAFGAFNVAIALGGATALAAGLLAFVSANRRSMIGAALALFFSLALLLANRVVAVVDYAPQRAAGSSRDKTMVNVLHDPAQAARLVYTAWDAFARVDVVETADPAAKFVFTDGGAGSFMLRFDGDLSRLEGWRDTVEFLPFQTVPGSRTLVLGAGAGKDVLLALLGGAGTVTAVEVNPAMFKAVRHFADYNGFILNRPDVEWVLGEGRHFIERSDRQYDLIYLNLVYTQAAEPASQALVESYAFTRQAFRAYLAHLTPRGHLAVVSHNALEGSRAAITGLAVLAEMGMPLPQALRHMALLMLPENDPTQRMTVMLLGKEPLPPETVAALAKEAGRLRLQPLFLSGVFEAPFTPLVQGSSLKEFLAGDPAFDLRPTDDDRPFFFHLNPGLPGPIAQALAIAAMLSALTVSAAFWPTRAPSAVSRRQRWPVLVLYVALIGVGFMLVEVTLIQRFQLVLGYPVLSVMVVLGALLLAGGLGSWLSQRWPPEALPRRVAMAALGSAGLVAIYSWPSPWPQAILGAPLAVRVGVLVALAALPGVPMGIPFPSALRLAGHEPRQVIPLLWGVNGAFSVLGSTLAVAIAMLWGFRWAMVIGAVTYLLLAWLVRRLQTD